MGLRTDIATSSLGAVLGVAGCDEDDLYAAMDWALERKEHMESALAARHLAHGTLCSMTCLRRRLRAAPARWGDRAPPRRGPLAAADLLRAAVLYRRGTVAIEVFESNTADPKTLARLISKLKHLFKLCRSACRGSGMLTDSRIRHEVRPSSLDSSSALRAPPIKTLVEESALHLSLFDVLTCSGTLHEFAGVAGVLP